MRHILSTLKHHKAAVVLILLEIALTCAIISNALFLIGDRLAAMRLKTGVADRELVTIGSSGLHREEDGEAVAAMRTDLAALRALPGVKAAAMTNALPLGGHYWAGGVSVQPGMEKSTLSDVVYYAGSEGFLAATGIRLERGRDFQPEEFADYSPFADTPPPAVAIVSRALAERLWPGQDPLGRRLYFGEKGRYPVQVVGVVEHLLNPRLGAPAGRELNLIFPAKPIQGDQYVLRTAPDMRERVLRDAQAALERLDADRMIEAKTYERTVSDYFHDDRTMVWLLLVVVGCLLALATLGVVGLSSFWVQQRTRQIGVRRAIGATRGDILRYFLAENFMIVAAGTVLGSIGAMLLNLWLMSRYELPHLPLAWLPVGALALWALGQAAALAPALRAAAVPPVVATRGS